MARPQIKAGRHGAKCVHCASTRVVKDGEFGGRQRWKCKECGKRTTLVIRKAPPCANPAAIRALRHSITRAKGTHRYVVTSAQNATPVHTAFFASLQTFCRVHKAQLIVIPYRYKNPTSMHSKAMEHDDWWAPELLPFILDKRTKLNPNLMLLADIKTQPTATSPLMGFESIAGSMSAIIGHPKLELTTVPTPQHRTPKILTTTGAVTKRNYLPSKAGTKGAFHHTFGACLVEIKGKAFHMRQLNAVRDGSFMDLDKQYSGAECTGTGGVAGLVMGDSHIEFIDPAVVTATFGKGGMVQMLKPDLLVWHDVWDGYARNHHHEGEAFINFAKHHAGTDDVGRTLAAAFEFVDGHTPSRTRNVFVPSNHPDVLAKWVKRADWRADPRNAEFLLETALVMLRGTSMGDTGAKVVDPFVYWAKKKLRCIERCTFLHRDESLQISGIEIGYHGDRGLNGARGSRKGFSRIGVKTIIGHSHSPGITEGSYQVGTSSRLSLEYNSGPSGWLHTHCLIYRNGKRSLVNVINGEWRA